MAAPKNFDGRLSTGFCENKYLCAGMIYMSENSLSSLYLSIIISHSFSKFTFNGDFCGPTLIRLGELADLPSMSSTKWGHCHATHLYRSDSFGKRLTFDTVTLIFFPTNFFTLALISGVLVQCFAKTISLYIHSSLFCTKSASTFESFISIAISSAMPYC